MPQENAINDKTIKLYVGGIDPSWSNEKVSEILSKHGKVIRTDVVKNYAFAFVENKDEATNIINGASGTSVDGFKIVIQISKNKQNLPEGDDLCFECGKGGHWAKECSQRRARLEGRRGFSGPGRGRDPYSNGRDRFNGPPPQLLNRDTYLRDSYPRNPYTRDAYYRDPYASEMYPRDLYSHDPYASRDLYGPDPYGRDYELDRYGAIGRARSPISRSPYIRTVDPYAAVREKLAYGDTPRVDQYPVRRETYDTIPPEVYGIPTRRMDVYERDPRRVDSYERDRYASTAGPTDKRYPEPAHPANVDYH